MRKQSQSFRPNYYLWWLSLSLAIPYSLAGDVQVNYMLVDWCQFSYISVYTGIRFIIYTVYTGIRFMNDVAVYTGVRFMVAYKLHWWGCSLYYRCFRDFASTLSELLTLPPSPTHLHTIISSLCFVDSSLHQDTDEPFKSFVIPSFYSFFSRAFRNVSPLQPFKLCLKTLCS